MLCMQLNISKHKYSIGEIMINRPLSVRNDDAFSSHSEDKEIIIITPKSS